jgi:hypothetical protein
MKLSAMHLELLLNDPALKSELLDYDDYSQLDLSNPANLMETEINRLTDGVIFVVKNYSELIRVFDNPPLMEMDPWPIVIYAIPGLYIVHEQWLDSDESNFFLNEEEAIKFSEDAYSTFLDIYRSMSG